MRKGCLRNSYSLTQSMEKIMDKIWDFILDKGPHLLLAIVILVVGLMLI